MLFLIFLCFIILGVEARNKELIDLWNEEKSSIQLELNSSFTNIFKDQTNLEHEDKNKRVESISNCLGKKKFIKEDISSKKNKKKLDWWQTCIIYEIYPRSFKDSTGTGVGDLRGIIEKIPYLKYLGVCAVWLTPIYPSPGIDMGYDISEYRGINEIMGTMEDFNELKNKLHENGIKIILDMVPNHTSDEHEWFIKSVQRKEPYTDYYVWADAIYVNGSRQVPNNWMSIFGNSMWEWNEKRQQYYLHQFYKQQPDLNFWNPLVRKDIKDMLRFWLDKGVDGFRMDAITHLHERQDLLDAPILNDGKIEKAGYTQALDECFYEVNDWRSLLDEYKKKDGQTRFMTIESYLNNTYTMKFYGNETNIGAHFPLNICLLRLTHRSAKEYVEIITEWISNLPSGAWSSWLIGNHDTHRATSKFGLELIDGIHMLQMLLPGTPVIYMGDELGMTNTYLRDDQILNKQLFIRREAGRTPFQWDSSPQAGFSNKTKTWLPINPNYVTVNVKSERNAKRSHLKIFKEIENLRKLEIFCTGNLELYEISEYVFAFSRSNTSSKTYFIVINLGSELENINLQKFKKSLFPKLVVKISSLYAEQNNGDIVSAKSFTLRPSAALVLESFF
ncbi:maltase A3-like isoform X1 [Rhopalosiphum maidis]|uniref:maltase A3-like isoform X1 n=1 Tax=Rhopalosiphum maidis TaxID=43146 RepID=UPI000EFF5405|nr:maltase A3-like isoform X1 [Rhopalosiphum maidis]